MECFQELAWQFRLKIENIFKKCFQGWCENVFYKKIGFKKGFFEMSLVHYTWNFPFPIISPSVRTKLQPCVTPGCNRRPPYVTHGTPCSSKIEQSRFQNINRYVKVCHLHPRNVWVVLNKKRARNLLIRHLATVG